MLRKAALAALVAALIAPAAAGAATTIGQSPPSGGVAGAVCGPFVAVDLLQLTNTTGNSYEIPAGGGVITSWQSTATSTIPVRLRVFDVQGSTVTPVAESDPETLAAAPSSFTTRIPVAGGETIGLLIAGGGATTDCYYSDSASMADVWGAAAAGPLGVSETIAQMQAEALINVSAAVEPDADGDGHGDETQDACPTDASTQRRCPTFTIGKRRLDKKRGTARITVTVTHAGVLELSGRDVVAARTEKAAAGKAKLVVRAKGRAKRKLKRNGEVKARATLAYTPTGGETSKRTIRVKLRLAG